MDLPSAKLMFGSNLLELGKRFNLLYAYFGKYLTKLLLAPHFYLFQTLGRPT